LLAEKQTEGRGRGANTWHSEPSTGIYCSVVLRPALAPSAVLVLTLAAGLAVHSAVQQIDHNLAPDLKWPNDGLLNGKKFCGILAEMNAEATRVRYVVAGIGLNVNQTTFPPELQPIATSLRLVTGTEWSRVELCAALLKSLDREYHGLLEGRNGHDSILRRFQERSSSVRGKHVYIEEHPELDGITAGLEERGFLQIETARGLETVLSGTVRVK
jgi:BirA family transcriptional regulator, biotin operon repressor / biotin---[acetyl-CoA-carboxylase] ligase